MELKQIFSPLACVFNLFFLHQASSFCFLIIVLVSESSKKCTIATNIPCHLENTYGSSHHVTKVELAEDLALLLRHAWSITQEKCPQLGGTLI